MLGSEPNSSLISAPTKNSTSFSYINHFNIEGVKDMQVLTSFKEYNANVYFRSFDAKIYRESEIGFTYSLELIKNIFIGTKLNYFNQWFKRFKSDDLVSFSNSLMYKGNITIYIGANNIKVSEYKKNQSHDILIKKTLENLDIQLHRRFYNKLTYDRLVLKYNFDDLNLYIGLQNKGNEFLSGLEFVVSKFVIRFSYESFYQIGVRNQIGISYLY